MRVRGAVVPMLFGVALSACGAIVGLGDLSFEGDGTTPDGGGSDGANGEGGGPDGGPGPDGAPDARTDGPLDAGSTRLAEITFEEGALTGGKTGAAAQVGTTTLATPGLRGGFAARCQGAASYLATGFSPKKEVFVTFEMKVSAINIGQISENPAVLKIFTDLGQIDIVAVQHDKLQLRFDATFSATSTTSVGLAADVRIGIHLKQGTPGLIEGFVTSSNGTFGAPFATIDTRNVGNTTSVEVGASTNAEGGYTAVFDDIFIDTAKLAVP